MRSVLIRRTLAFGLASGVVLGAAERRAVAQDQARFRSGIELVNVTATVIDSNGRFVTGLRQSDFTVYEDGRPVEIAYFSAERVPLSLGIVLDTSGSMAGAKIQAARAALDRFLKNLLGPGDEVFLYRFDTTPRLVQGWTTEYGRISAELARLHPDGATSLYDAVARALPLVQGGRHRKKAMLVISDGMDTSSDIDRQKLKQLIRESETLIYAIGMDAARALSPSSQFSPDIDFLAQRRRPMPFPLPFPGRRTPPRTPPMPGVPRPGLPRPPSVPTAEPPSEDPGGAGLGGNEGVDAAALRDITDDSGGRTEVVRHTRDLDPATARIADELSRQYALGYPSPGHRDGKWHTIRVEVKERSLRVRARRGYLAASPQ
jgi:VWFA-related protein